MGTINTVLPDGMCITGTGTSSNAAARSTENRVAKCALATHSGPYGGDAEAAGALAADFLECPKSKDYKRLVRGIVFFSDEGEAHRLDIFALKALVGYLINRYKDKSKFICEQHLFAGWDTMVKAQAAFKETLMEALKDAAKKQGRTVPALDLDWQFGM